MLCASPSIAADQGYRYVDGACVNATGARGLNPQYVGECGDLAGDDLSRQSLAAMSLKGAVLRDADLSGADLTESDLTGALLDGANLEFAQLSRVVGRGASFKRIRCNSADFAEAVLSGARFDEAICFGADFTSADLFQANFSGAVLNDSQLANVNLAEARLTGARLLNAQLPGATLTSVSGVGLNASWADFKSVVARGANFTDAVLIGTDFSSADLFEAMLVRAVATRVKLRGAVLRGAVVTDAAVEYANLSAARAEDADFSGSDLSGTFLMSTTMTGATVEGTRFYNAIYSSVTALPFAESAARLAGMRRVEAERIATGNNHTCFLTPDLQVWCWGVNNVGQLGNGSSTTSATPMRVALPDDTYVDLATGGDHSCALTIAGKAYCWGIGRNGQIGDQTSTDAFTPKAVVQGTLRFSAITGGANHTCGLTTQRDVYCWGLNNQGQLGTGNLTSSTVPVRVVGDHQFAAIAASVAGSSTCGLNTQGQAYCWGLGSSGQLGNNAVASTSSPVAVVQDGLLFDQISASTTHACARARSGLAYCWGSGATGELGNGSTSSQSAVPVQVVGLTDTRVISIGASHGCAASAGGVTCWGYNADGRLGTGDAITWSIPRRVPNLESGGSLAVGAAHACATTMAHELFCWGVGTAGQLGYGQARSSTAPVRVTIPTSFEFVPVRLRGVDLVR